MNIGRITGGHNVNVVPSSCVLEIARRLLPDEDVQAAYREIGEILNALAVSEGLFFADDDIEIVNFGPGDGATSHAANEYVPLDQMVDAAIILRATIERLLGL
jgi:acetylornithine deacetylase/succinyl-diaminopimelate desuccinylase-like protein